MKTVVVNTKTIKHDWYVVDATNQMAGRLSSKIANLLIGKSKPAFSPNQDHGDNIVVINAEKIKLSGTKMETKEYFRHSQHPGGAHFRSFKEQMEIDPTQIIRHAVHGMLSKKPLGRAMMKKLHIYTGAEHPHTAQQPKAISL